MALIVQNDAGSDPNANGYLSAEEFKAYHADRGKTFPKASAAEIASAIVRASDYLDQRFQFVGQRRYRGQLLAWPRQNARDNDGGFQNGVPSAVKRATAEYAARALERDLNPDPTLDPSGRNITEFSEKLGPLEETTKYSDPSPVLPSFPAADLLLRRSGLLVSGGTIRLG